MTKSILSTMFSVGKTNNNSTKKKNRKESKKMNDNSMKDQSHTSIMGDSSYGVWGSRRRAAAPSSEMEPDFIEKFQELSPQGKLRLLEFYSTMDNDLATDYLEMMKKSPTTPNDPTSKIA